MLVSTYQICYPPTVTENHFLGHNSFMVNNTPTHSQSKEGFRYMGLADRLEAYIRNGAFRAGEKLPSIRRLHTETGLSISTVYQAFMELEKRGMVEARRKSGYFAKPLIENLLPIPKMPASPVAPRRITLNNLVFTLCEAMSDPQMLQLGGAVMGAELLPGKTLAAIAKSFSARALVESFCGYGHFLGYAPLRRLIAQRCSHFAGRVAADDVMITNGCVEAVSVCLRAVAQPGDTILVESPTFPWFLQAIEDFGMYALEIPGSAQNGIDVDAIAAVIRRHAVKACIFNVNFNNPLGYRMCDERKKVLVELLSAAGIPIIEDDIYGDLYFASSRPAPLKAFDRQGTVLYCASFSKTLSPGIRVGWTLPGRYLEKVRRLKLNHTISQPNLPQMVVAEYLRNGSYDRHLRKLRTCLKNQVGSTALAIARHFPAGTRISAPKGGLILWVELDRETDSLALFTRALAKRIAFMPGIICAGSPVFANCLRISCGSTFTPAVEKGIRILADIIRESPSSPIKEAQGDLQ
jgi:DNA-binding transcriptional MocR family regulator